MSDNSIHTPKNYIISITQKNEIHLEEKWGGRLGELLGRVVRFLRSTFQGTTFIESQQDTQKTVDVIGKILQSEKDPSSATQKLEALQGHVKKLTDSNESLDLVHNLLDSILMGKSRDAQKNDENTIQTPSTSLAKAIQQYKALTASGIQLPPQIKARFHAFVADKTKREELLKSIAKDVIDKDSVGSTIRDLHRFIMHTAKTQQEGERLLQTVHKKLTQYISDALQEDLKKKLNQLDDPKASPGPQLYQLEDLRSKIQFAIGTESLVQQAYAAFEDSLYNGLAGKLSSSIADSLCTERYTPSEALKHMRDLEKLIKAVGQSDKTEGLIDNVNKTFYSSISDRGQDVAGSIGIQKLIASIYSPSEAEAELSSCIELIQQTAPLEGSDTLVHTIKEHCRNLLSEDTACDLTKGITDKAASGNYTPYKAAYELRKLLKIIQATADPKTPPTDIQKKVENGIYDFLISEKISGDLRLEFLYAVENQGIFITEKPALRNVPRDPSVKLADEIVQALDIKDSQAIQKSLRGELEKRSVHTVSAYKHIFLFAYGKIHSSEEYRSFLQALMQRLDSAYSEATIANLYTASRKGDSRAQQTLAQFLAVRKVLSAHVDPKNTRLDTEKPRENKIFKLSQELDTALLEFKQLLTVNYKGVTDRQFIRLLVGATGLQTFQEKKAMIRSLKGRLGLHEVRFTKKLDTPRAMGKSMSERDKVIAQIGIDFRRDMNSEDPTPVKIQGEILHPEEAKEETDQQKSEEKINREFGEWFDRKLGAYIQDVDFRTKILTYLQQGGRVDGLQFGMSLFNGAVFSTDEKRSFSIDTTDNGNTVDLYITLHGRMLDQDPPNKEITKVKLEEHIRLRNPAVLQEDEREEETFLSLII